MKHHILILALLLLFLNCIGVKAQAPDSTIYIKGETDTLKDYTHWANKGSVAFIPIHMQPGFNGGLLNYGVGVDIAFALPKFITFRGKAIVNIFEGDRSMWKEKVYDNATEVSKGYWIEGGIDLNFFDKKSKSTTVILDSTGQYIYTEGTQREYRKGAYTDKSHTFTQALYGEYYSFDSYIYRPALRIGIVQYKFTHLDKEAITPLLTNILINTMYGGLSFSKIGLGKSTYFTVYADMMYKISLKSITDIAYETKSIKNQLGYRAGIIGGFDWLGGLAEVGMAPGIDKLEPYLKIGLLIQHHLLPKRQHKYIKKLPEADLVD